MNAKGQLKSSLILKRLQKLEKNLPLVLTLLSKAAVLSKQVGDFFQILRPSHNVLTLISGRNFGVFK